MRPGSPKRATAPSSASRVDPLSSKWLRSSRCSSSRRRALGTCAASTIRSMKRSMSSRMAVTQDRPHCGRDLQPLLALRLSLAAALRSQTVVLARSSCLAHAPAALEQPGSLHVVERRVERAFFQLEGARAAALRLPKQLVAVHLTLAQQAQNQDADSSGE